MKHNYLILLFLTLSITTTQAQFQSTSYSVSRSDLEINEYAVDSTANALVIFEEGNSYIDDKSFKLVTEIKRKVKIFNKKGFDHANIEIYLHKTKKYKEKVKNIIATTYNLVDGNLKKDILSKDQIFNENYNSYNDIVKFTLPNIQEGCVITYSYKIESSFIYKYKDWDFQESIPKLYSNYNTSIPAYYDYNIKLVGFLKLDENSQDLKRHCLDVGNGGSADCTETVYIMKDIPAFIEEEYLTSKWNYISRIEYELNAITRVDGSVDKISKTWKDADQELKSMPSIGKQLNKKTNLNDLISGLEYDKTDPLSKPKELYKFVQERYTWNKKYRIFKDISTKELVQSRSGNATEINILLHNLLKENGFDVKPVLISTRENGLPTKLYPVISEFNYLIVELFLDNKYYYLDATDKYLYFGQLPFKCLNEYGRVLDFKGGSYWTSIEENKPSVIQQQVILQLDDDNKLKGKINSRYTGYHALSKKKDYFPNPDSYIEDIEESLVNVEIINHELLSDDPYKDEFKESFDIVLSENEMIEDKIYLNPFIFKFFTENPFKLQQRTYPIDFGYKDAYLYSFELDLSDKYEIIDTPKDTHTKLPNNAGEFIFSSNIVDNKLKLFLKIDFRKSKYAHNYYEYLKKFMSRVVDAQTNSLVVLKKK